VVKELGWPVIAVLKQERYDIYQEALALTHAQGQGVENPAERTELDLGSGGGLGCL
jgi:hypothetical protein